MIGLLLLAAAVLLMGGKKEGKRDTGGRTEDQTFVETYTSWNQDYIATVTPPSSTLSQTEFFRPAAAVAVLPAEESASIIAAAMDLPQVIGVPEVLTITETGGAAFAQAQAIDLSLRGAPEAAAIIADVSRVPIGVTPSTYELGKLLTDPTYNLYSYLTPETSGLATAAELAELEATREARKTRLEARSGR